MMGFAHKILGALILPYEQCAVTFIVSSLHSPWLGAFLALTAFAHYGTRLSRNLPTMCGSGRTRK